MYRFYSKSNSNERVTIVGQYHSDKGILKLAAARCSKKDQFIKKKGRVIAEGRLAKEKLIRIVHTPEISTELFISHAIRIAESVLQTKKTVLL